MTKFCGSCLVLSTTSVSTLFLAAPASSKTITVNQTNIVKSLNAALPGDKFVLLPGGYGVITLPRKTWQKPIIIDARAASMTGVVIQQVSGVIWVGGTIFGTGYGVNMRWAQNVTVSDVKISSGFRGIVINDSSDLKILRNRIRGVRIDGIDVVGQRILVEGNVISDMKPELGDHPDGIQLWSANDEQTLDVTLRNNTITGHMQGIFGGARDLGMKNIFVTGNKVTIAYGNGIALTNLQDSTATGNIVKSTADRINRANMRIEGSNIVACGNVVPDVPTTPPARPCA